MQQFYAMFLKRALYSWRNWKVMVAQFLVPLVFTVVALVVARTLPGRHNTPQLKLSLERYGPTHVPVALEPTAGPLAVALAQAYSSQLSEQGAAPNNVTGECFTRTAAPVYYPHLGVMGMGSVLKTVYTVTSERTLLNLFHILLHCSSVCFILV